ncbi:DUF3732 domain-containing protein [Saccharothrix sp. Mg75]|uniref:DUF3732 domain-containing protein n=1 Tax=Saccharothrix sp. Mg75 TaxID=3445357 RepID=UPI003EEF5698
MTWQLKSLTLYGKQPGQVRSLEFNLGELNIVTGDSLTGKTSIWDVTNYCMASSGDNYPISAGKLREYVDVFAVQIVRGDRQLFVARPAARGTTPSPRLCLVFQQPGDLPLAAEQMQFTFTIEAARGLLAEFTGIDLSIRLPTTRGNTMAPSIRHALYFCIQAQNVVANPDHLFHSQGEDHGPRTIRDIFPYFIGAVDPEQAVQRAQLQRMKSELRNHERDLNQQESAAPASGQARALVREAVETSLLDPLNTDELTLDDALALLGTAASAPLPGLPEIPEDEDDPLATLSQERDRLRIAFQQTRARLAELRSALRDRSEFLTQALDHRERLTSLSLLKVSPDTSLEACPVCNSEVTAPSAVATALRTDLEELNANVVHVSDDTPQIQALIDEQEELLREHRRALGTNHDERDALEAGMREAARYRDTTLRAAAVRGRISLFLENAARYTVAPRIRDQREEMRAAIEELEDALGHDVQADRVNSSLSLINQKITAKARALVLEHSDAPIRFDLRRLTVVADTNEGPVPLKEIGGGQNWLGYHLAAFLSLHEWFIDHNRPVPQLLVLDQPSQVYFPADYKETDLQPAEESDRAALLRAYQAIANTITSADGKLQVIAMEHADLEQPVFVSAVIRRWRDGQGALVPAEWITAG